MRLLLSFLDPPVDHCGIPGTLQHTRVPLSTRWRDRSLFCDGVERVILCSRKSSQPICNTVKKSIKTGESFRSEEGGTILLDMIGWYLCSIEARRLGRETRELDIRQVVFE